MRTAAVQPRILSKKNIFHLRINGGTQESMFSFLKIFFHLHIHGRAQERNFNYIKIFCMVFVVLYSYTCMYTKYNYFITK